MHTISVHRLTALCAVTAMLSLGSARAESFPPLHTPPSTEQNPGKFVWADLFTADPDAATTFYTKLFGWTSTTLFQKGKVYTVLSNAGHPVAGIVPRSRGKDRPSRWIGYVAVNDAAGAVAKVTTAGGTVRAPARNFPDRGTQAIVSDPEGSTVGILQSSSGDTPDDEPQPGDWNWFELYAQKPTTACEFYRQVFGYDVAPDTRTERKDDFMLSSSGEPRAGVAPLPDREDAKPGWLGVIRVANLDATLAKVPELGGEVLLAPRPAAYESRFAIVADPTGGALGLVEYVDNANPATAPAPATPAHENNP